MYACLCLGMSCHVMSCLYESMIRTYLCLHLCIYSIKYIHHTYIIHNIYMYIHNGSLKLCDQSSSRRVISQQICIPRRLEPEVFFARAIGRPSPSGWWLKKKQRYESVGMMIIPTEWNNPPKYKFQTTSDFSW